MLCLLSEGHLIIEDFPGVGKTTLAKAIARSVGRYAPGPVLAPVRPRLVVIRGGAEEAS